MRGIGIAVAIKRRGRIRGLIPAVVVLYFVGFFMLFVPLPRFRNGVVPFLSIYAGAAIAAIGEVARRMARGKAPSSIERSRTAAPT